MPTPVKILNNSLHQGRHRIFSRRLPRIGILHSVTMLTYPLSESGMAVRNQPLPFSAGQVCTGPAIFNQLDLFLPPCPITSRYNVIPASYNGRVHADFSHNFPLTKPLHGGGRLLTRQGLGKTKSIDGSPRQSLRWLQIRPCRMLFRPIVAGRPDRVTLCRAAEGLTK